MEVENGVLEKGLVSKVAISCHFHFHDCWKKSTGNTVGLENDFVPLQRMNCPQFHVSLRDFHNRKDQMSR